ncbi:MAG: ATP-binding protein [Pseudomonadota bacterium]
MTTDESCLEKTVRCPRHGEYKALLIPAGFVKRELWTRCPRCDDEKQQREQRERSEARAREQLQSWRVESGLVGRYLETTFATYVADTPAQREVLAACSEYASAPAKGWRPLWLVGLPGTGKTHLGAAMVLDSIERGRRAAMVNARQLVRTLRNTWRRDSEETESDAIKRYASVPLLVLDELGVGSGSDAEITQLYDVLDMRYQLCRPLVVISNLLVTEMRAAVGDRLFDRLRENAKVLMCDWPSYRGRNHSKGE